MILLAPRIDRLIVHRESRSTGVFFVRNLIGRLNARTPSELGRIATAWHVPLGSTDKPGQVGQIYRALTDPRAVRDAWSELAPENRALITALANAPV